MNKKIFIKSLFVIAVFFVAQVLAAKTTLSDLGDNNSLIKKQNESEKISNLFVDTDEDNDVYALANSLKQSEMPVAETEVYTVDDAEGVVVFIPQTHINPGTKVADPINDSAEVAQKEIYDLLAYLNNETGINLLMLEGEAFGLAREEKVETVKGKLELKRDLEVSRSSLERELKKEGVSSEEISSLLAYIDKEIAYLDREIALQGAPYKLKAENPEIVVYGSENKDTYLESSQIVKNYIYQKDRLAQLEKTETKENKSLASGNMLDELKAKIISGNASINLKSIFEQISLDKSFSIASLLGQNQTEPCKTSAYQNALQQIDEIGENSGNDNISSLVEEIGNKNKELDTLRSQNVSSLSSGTKTQSRSDNPYKEVMSRDEIESEIEKSEEKIQAVVIDQRNTDTAKNFKSALEETGESVGVLQFGAGHEEGLIDELNKQGLSVVVVKTDEIIRRELAN